MLDEWRKNTRDNTIPRDLHNNIFPIAVLEREREWSGYFTPQMSCHHFWFMFMFMSASQLCMTLGNPMDDRPPGSSVHGILQARILERVAMSSCRGFSWLREWTWIFCIVRLFTLSQEKSTCFWLGNPNWKPKARNLKNVIHMGGPSRVKSRKFIWKSNWW